MKINSIVSAHTGYPSKGMPEYHSSSKYKYAKRQNDLKQNNNDQISTTIKNNSDGRVSFKGGAPLLHKIANFTSDNPLVAESLFAILITCGLRPLSIMATAKNEEDKQKCTYQAAKSISSGLIGLAMTALVGTPIALATKTADKNGAFKMPENIKEKSKETVKKGVDALSELAAKLQTEGRQTELAEQISSLTADGEINLSLFKKAGKRAEPMFKKTINKTEPSISKTVNKAIKEQHVLNNYSKTAKNVADKLFQPVFMPLRAGITISMVPVIIGLFGIKKSGKSSEKQEQPPFDYINYNVLRTEDENNVFKPFSGVTNNENK